MAMMPYTQHLHWARLRGPLLFAVAIFYLCFHAISGERGIYALFKERRRLEVLHVELDKVTEKRVAMERKVRLMRSTSLDLDLLDEQSRDVLGYAGQGEVVYYTGK